jgi:hypothetical protein
MASRSSLFTRILQAVIHRVWTVLFFLTAFCLATLANHWWNRILGLYGSVEAWIATVIGQ